MNESIRISGVLSGKIIGPDGKIKEEFVHNNLVVTSGRQHIANQLSSLSEGAMTHMAIGLGDQASGAADPVVGDTELQYEWSRLLLSKVQGTGGDANKVVYSCAWEPGVGDGSITEAGIFNSNSSGIMLCRTTFPVKNKGAGDSLTLSWTITISG